MHNYKELKVWKKAMELAKTTYILMREMPSEEKYGLTSQIKRSVISVPSNIAEGAGRRTKRDFAKYLSIAVGSLYELETQIQLSFDLELVAENKEIFDNIIEVQKMLHGLVNSLDT